MSGLALGSMYGLIALGFHITYVVSNTVNFSQGRLGDVGAVLGYIFAVPLGWPLRWPCCRSARPRPVRAGGGAHPGSAGLVRGSNAWLWRR